MHYADSPIAKDIPIRVRKVLIEQLGNRWWSVKPADDLLEDDDLDFVELLYEFEDEFGISISKNDMDQIEPTFDSVVQYVARKFNQMK